MRKFVMLLLVFCITMNINTLFADTPSVSKQDIIKKAVKNSFQIQQQQNNILQLDNEYKTAMVNLRVYSFYKDMNEKLTEISGIKTPTTADIMERDLILISLGYYETAKQNPMMMLPKDTRTLNLRHLLEIYNNTKESTANSLIISMNTTLSEIAKSKQQIAMQRSLISNLEKNLLNANNKFKYGLISKSQLSQLELKKKIADIELRKLDLNNISLYEKLSKIVGEKVTYNTEITGNSITDVAELKSIEYYIDYTLKNKKDIRISYNNSLFKEISYQISIQNYGIESKSETFRESYITYSNAVNDYEDLKLSTRLQIYNIYSENEQQLTNLAKAQNNLEIAQSNYKQAQQKYGLGQITDYDLASKNIDMVKSQSEYFNIKRNVYISRLKLNQACGIIIQ
jgi:hypothetical protein